jgi:hypothetical protein
MYNNNNNNNNNNNIVNNNTHEIIKTNLETDFLEIKNNLNIDDKLEIDQINQINQIDYINENNLCIICWFQDGKTILCASCKYKYCDDCVKKISNKCCICYRIKDKYVYFDNEEFEINYCPHFYTGLLGVLSGSIFFLILSSGMVYIFIMILSKLYSTLQNLYFI